MVTVFYIFIYILLLLVAYIIGSIPVGYICARYFGIADIRQHGSGTIGATNVARILGKKFFVLIFVLDAGKAYLFLVGISSLIPQLLIGLSAICLVLGNTRSIFLNFTGGKGVATYMGSILALTNLYILLLSFGVWAILLACLQIVGLASIGAMIAIPVFSAFLYPDNYSLLITTIVISSWSIWLHKAHIATYFSKESK